jgi:hypothetical protein
MPMRMQNNECKVMGIKKEDENGEMVLFCFCQHIREGKPCVRDAKGGKKASTLSPACFEVMSDTDFLNKIILREMPMKEKTEGADNGN